MACVSAWLVSAMMTCALVELCRCQGECEKLSNCSNQISLGKGSKIELVPKASPGNAHTDANGFCEFGHKSISYIYGIADKSKRIRGAGAAWEGRSLDATPPFSIKFGFIDTSITYALGSGLFFFLLPVSWSSESMPSIHSQGPHPSSTF